MNNNRLLIGAWSFPSGNSCTATAVWEGRRGHVWFAWDDPPPLTPEDEAFYLSVVIPAMVKRVGELGMVDVVR